MTRWMPRGLVFPSREVAEYPWIRGYAALPFAVPSGPETARVFFSGRDGRNRAHIGACTLDLGSMRVKDADARPLLSPGALGGFDDSGCSMSCIVRAENRWFLYYTGWMLGRTVPFYLAIGLAISEDGGRSFARCSPAPILERNSIDPFLTASPSVMFEEGRWRMWYVSAIDWQIRNGQPRHRYLIKYAESKDGIAWNRDGHVAVEFEDDEEYALGRPHVVRTPAGYRMWFCARGDQYRIACADSPDGLTWTRQSGDAGPRRQEWDVEMQAYPMVFQDGERWIMLYNGNGYGATGFGYATAEEEP
ncbi:MAG TPA: hypothetical protein VHW00_09745 [Thermoanaerobaculia bacterium]|nr:hypothetical protein [Thermoanaerobaculia bacterium]